MPRGEIVLWWLQGVLLLLLLVFFLHTPISFPQQLSHVTLPPAVGKGSFLHIFISAYYFFIFGGFYFLENNSYPDGTEGALVWLVSVNDFMCTVSYFSWEIIKNLFSLVFETGSHYRVHGPFFIILGFQDWANALSYCILLEMRLNLWMLRAILTCLGSGGPLTSVSTAADKKHRCLV